MPQLKTLKKGEYFTLKEIAEPKENQVYVRGDYDRSTKKYYCSRFDDISSGRLMKANKEVYTDFIF